MRIIYSVDEVMQSIKVIQGFEERKFSDIPKWEGWIENWTENAVLLHFNVEREGRRSQFWFPYSQLRKAGDDQSIYASTWILDRKGL